MPFCIYVSTHTHIHMYVYIRLHVCIYVYVCSGVLGLLLESIGFPQCLFLNNENTCAQTYIHLCFFGKLFSIDNRVILSSQIQKQKINIHISLCVISFATHIYCASLDCQACVDWIGFEFYFSFIIFVSLKDSRQTVIVRKSHPSFDYLCRRQRAIDDVLGSHSMYIHTCKYVHMHICI